MLIRSAAQFLAASFLLLITLVSRPSLAETDTFNIHVELAPAFPLVGWQAEELGVGTNAGLRVELGLAKWIGIDAGLGYLHFFGADHPQGYQQIESVDVLCGSLGLRFRLHNDENGYKWSWKERPNHIGNLWGNLWIDFHGDYIYTGSLSRFGGDVGLGAEFSLVNGLQVGPFVRGLYIYQPDSINKRDSEDAWLLLAGLSFSLIIPPKGKVLPDADNDGITDPNDSCPKIAEDIDNFEDEDGCPDNDNDGDGIADKVDKCPNKAEDHDDFQDDDGCPDEDNDSDGILDDKDECPNEAEDPDDFEDEDGCPDNDNDEDGFKDDEDTCPNEAETVNGFEDDDGCPDDGLVEVKANRILLGDRIFFDFSMARLKTQAREILLQLFNLLVTHPEYTLISIEGHADEEGSAEFNLDLAHRRAEQVLKYLVRCGIESSRLVVESRGEDSPWVSPQTRKEMAKNRRVELIILRINEGLADTPMSHATRQALDNEVAGEAPPPEEDIQESPDE